MKQTSLHHINEEIELFKSYGYNTMQLLKMKSMLLETHLKFSSLAWLLKSPIFIGKTGLWQVKEYGQENTEVSLFLHEAKQFGRPKSSVETFKEDFDKDFESLIQEEIYYMEMDSFRLKEDYVTNSELVSWAINYNSPVVRIPDNKSNDFQKDLFSQFTCYNSNKRYMIKELESTYQEKYLSFERCKLNDLELYEWLVTNSVNKFAGSEFIHACGLFLYGVTLVDNVLRYCLKDDKGEIIGIIILEIHKDTLVNQVVSINRDYSKSIPSIGNILIYKVLESCYFKNDFKFFEVTACTDPFNEELEVYKRLFLNQSNTRYAFISGTMNKIKYYQYSPPYRTEKGWIEDKIVINPFSKMKDWEHNNETNR